MRNKEIIHLYIRNNEKIKNLKNLIKKLNNFKITQSQ